MSSYVRTVKEEARSCEWGLDGDVEVSVFPRAGSRLRLGVGVGGRGPKLLATPTQTLSGEEEVGFFQCSLGYVDDSAWFLAEEVTLTM